MGVSSVLIGDPDDRIFAERIIVVNGAGVQQTNLMSSASQIYVNERDAATRVTLYDATTGLPIPPSSLGVSVPGTTTQDAIVTWNSTTGGALKDNPGIVVGTGGALQTAGVGNGATAGNARGTGAVDLQTLRTAATQVASGNYSIALGQSCTSSNVSSTAIGNNCTASGGFGSVAIGSTNVASGAAAVAIGFTCTASAGTVGSVAVGNNVTASSAGSFAFGLGTTANRAGEFVWSSGNFAGSGTTRDCVRSEIILRGETTNATVTELTSPARIVLANDTSITFEIKVTARRTDADNESASYMFIGCIDRNATAASTALVGTVTKTVIAEDTVSWDVNVDANTTDGALRIQVTGEAAKTIRWTAHYIGVETTG